MLVYISSTLFVILLFLKKFQFSLTLYPIVIVLLLAQVVFLYLEYQKKLQETFEEEEEATNPTLKSLDIPSLKVIYQTPIKMKNEIEPSLYAFVNSTKANDDTVFLNSQKKKYSNTETRKVWRQVDYLFEKIKIFSPKIYAAIVPKLTSKQIEDDKNNEENEELVSSNDSNNDPETMRKERELKDTQKRLKQEFIEEQRL